jgi:hypothetical protein
MRQAPALVQRAEVIARANPPGEVLRKTTVLLENAFLGIFAAIGWVFGRAWFLVFVIGLALADGFSRGRNAAPKAFTAEGRVPPPDPEHQGEPGPGNTYVYSERA